MENTNVYRVFESKMGIVMILPSRKAQTLFVELWLEDIPLGTYTSAQFAAMAVALGRTAHKSLDELSLEDRPKTLEQWGVMPA